MIYTPRTETVYRDLISHGLDFTYPAHVMDRHARKLERENVRLRKALIEIRDECFSGAAHDIAVAALEETK